MISYILKLLINLLSLPIYYLSGIVPRNKCLWVFGAWRGRTYSDNPKYLFEFVKGTKKEITAVWITKNKNIINEKESIYYYLSFKGIIYTLMAGKSFVTHESSDINSTLLCRCTLINMTHGSPIKKIGKDASYQRFGKMTGFYDALSTYISPQKKVADYIFVASERDRIIFKNALDYKIDVIGFGYPRWKPLLDIGSTREEFEKFDKIIMYAPTLRKMNREQLNPAEFSGLRELISLFEERNYLLLIRPHPSMKLNLEDFYCDNLKLCDSSIESDINVLLSNVDILISDFSSVIYDFDILKRPILLLSPDSEEYINHDVGIYGDYYIDTPGIIVNNWFDVASEIKKNNGGTNLHCGNHPDGKLIMEEMCGYLEGV